MPGASLVTYDQVPYLSGSFRQTHPCHLAVLPHLFGLEPPPVRGCRVLELGCASGGNIIPMAQDLPESEFVGIDLSARQIADGCGLLAELSLPNVELRHLSILDVADSLGQFDYILCHGVYSWVPRKVQDKILEIGSRNLRSGGVCYVSYNTYPGWHLRGVVRDMMQYHVAPFSEPQTKIDQARCLLDFLNKSSSPRSEAYRRLLADEAEILNNHSDSYLFHEHLEENNEPLYFHEFIERAAAAGLQYLAEADFNSMIAENFAPETAAILQGAPLLRQEQYMDFLRNRMFRSTVLCHATVNINRSIPATRLTHCHVALQQQLPLENPALSTSDEMKVPLGGETITANQPLTKAALVVLNESWPASMSFDDLLSAAVAKVDAAQNGQSAEARAAAPPVRELSADERRSLLARDLMTLFIRGLLRAQIDPPLFVSAPGAQPCTTALARTQARRGEVVTNRRHETVRLADLTRALLPLLDGRHDRRSLLDWLRGAIARGEFRVLRDEAKLTDVDAATLEQILDGSLKTLAQCSLLIA
jgi:methyltransferase-like protein/cyclopropane fatty-acyl-phospholipid synthase-like methyltransferase